MLVCTLPNPCDQACASAVRRELDRVIGANTSVYVEYPLRAEGTYTYAGSLSGITHAGLADMANNCAPRGIIVFHIMGPRRPPAD